MAFPSLIESGYNLHRVTRPLRLHRDQGANCGKGEQRDLFDDKLGNAPSS